MLDARLEPPPAAMIVLVAAGLAGHVHHKAADDWLVTVDKGLAALHDDVAVLVAVGE